MKKLKVRLLMTAVGLAGMTYASVQAQWKPTYAEGPCKEFHQDECERLMQYKAQEDATKRADDERRQQYRAQEAAYQKAKQEEATRQQAAWAADRRQREEEQTARQAALQSQIAAEDRAERNAARAASEAEAVKKSECGSDFKNIKIGMPVPRVLQCVSGSFKPSGQTNTAQGVVTTYRAPGGYFHAIDGLVVQWGKF